MKVLFVINAAITGGAERHSLTLADDLINYGIVSHIFALRRAMKNKLMSDKLHEPLQLKGFFARVRELACFIDTQKIDVVVAVNQRPLAAVVLARIICKRTFPIAAILHTTLLRNRKEELMQIVYDQLYNRADKVIFISGNQQKHWLARGMRPKSAITILNGIDANFFTETESITRARVRADLGYAEGDYVIGCCAMLRPEKNHIQLIEAIAALREKGLPAHGLFVGDGEMRSTLIAQARSLGLETKIHITGHQVDVRPFIAAFDVGVLCSTAVETLSLSALEIMSTGVPMLMSDIGGASEIIDGSNGLIFPQGDLSALIDAIHTISSAADPAEKSRAARATTLQKFSVSRMNNEYHMLFKAMAADSIPLSKSTLRK